MKRIMSALLLVTLLMLLCGCNKQKLEITGDNLATGPEAQSTAALETMKQPEAAAGSEQTAITQEEPSAETESSEPTQAASQRVKSSQNRGNGRYVFGMILLLLLSGAGLYFSYLIPKRIAERKRHAKARQAARRAQMQDLQRRSQNPPQSMSEQPVFKDGHWI